ncbi:MAG: hypothetical protein PHT69_10735 [Bacteroidales bacterium]|nr:hypothetical protein [Bacteroidales bacterium]
MTTENNQNECGCGPDCCQPKKSNIWKKLLFAAVLIAATAIVTVKLTGNTEKKAPSCCDSTSVSQSGCCDSTDAKITNIQDSTKIRSCCPNANK